MKTNPDSNDEDALLEAVLRDDGWQTANTAGKAAALQVFQARQRVRRLTRWGGGLAVLAVMLAGIAHWLAGPATRVPVRLAESFSSTPAKPEKSLYLTDEQLLAMFPEGSCFLAEVDGKKKLVFFDPEIERQFVYAAGPQPTFTQ